MHIYIIEGAVRSGSGRRRRLRRHGALGDGLVSNIHSYFMVCVYRCVYIYIYIYIYRDMYIYSYMYNYSYSYI